jgi:hypothetical protein
MAMIREDNIMTDGNSILEAGAPARLARAVDSDPFVAPIGARIHLAGVA